MVRLQIIRLILSEFKRINWPNKLTSIPPLKSSENLRFCDDFRWNRH